MPMPHFTRILRAALVASLVPLAAPAVAAPAVVAVDAATGRVLVDQGAGRPMHPASLTKLMTAYVALAELKAGRLRLDEQLRVSERAASEGGSVLGLRAGETIRLDQALAALVARSGNDAAVVIAERIAGSEEAFAERMNVEAARLGMTASHFRNATGLSVAGHVSTPRDMAVLALALRRDFPDRMGMFAVRRVEWHGRDLPTVNAFLVNYQGALGMKTGFTCHAGYNLVAAAGRNGRVAVVVVMGAVSKAERQGEASRTMDRALGGTLAEGVALSGLADLATPPPDLAGPACGGGGAIPQWVGRGSRPMEASARSGWGVELSFASRRDTARRQAALALARNPRFAKGDIVVVAAVPDGMVHWRGLATGLAEKDAVQGCLALRAKAGEDACLVLTPAMVEGAFDTQRRLWLAQAME
jgi:D-alanyl-D-alanine carboxypeptidase